jgi:hypothetical protein
MDEHEDGGGRGGARGGASTGRARADGAVGAVDVRGDGSLAVDVPRPVACGERLAICAESGDVSEARAMVLAREDARLCAAGRRCMCEVKR